MKHNSLSIVAIIMSLMALTLGGATAANDLITSGDIRNGSITAKDLKRNSVTAGEIRKNAVRSTDLRAAAVQTSDIEDGAVTPEDVTMPVPAEFSLGSTSGAVSGAFGHLATFGTYNKVTADALEVSWSGVVASGPATNCVFQLRVNGLPSTRFGGEVFAPEQNTNVSTSALFVGLAPGPVTVELWAKSIASANPSGPSCVAGPANPGIGNNVVVSEIVS